ncbi:hypothetical protein RUM43_001590 [Polyplax serrata]|uniref:Uncharacterized protein n=1 Tax=Polyplax serrata TaxID=468196 RepID=A0AAN8SF01_POLSC
MEDERGSERKRIKDEEGEPSERPNVAASPRSGSTSVRSLQDQRDIVEFHGQLPTDEENHLDSRRNACDSTWNAKNKLRLFRWKVLRGVSPPTRGVAQDE